MFRKFIYEYYDQLGHHIKRAYTPIILNYEELTEDEKFRVRVEIYKDDKLIHERCLKYAVGLEAVADYMCTPDGEKTVVYEDEDTMEYKTAKIKLEEES